MKTIHNKKFFDGGLNGDSALAGLLPNQFINGQNIRFGSSDRGANDRVESIGGNVNIANSLPPLPTDVTIYDENTEWVGDAFPGTVADFDNTADPFHLLKAVDLTSSLLSTILQFNAPAKINLYPFEYLEFYIKLKAVADTDISVYFSTSSSGADIIGNAVNIVDYGFIPSISGGTVDVYQQIRIPISAFGNIKNDVNSLFFSTDGVIAYGFYLDYIRLIARSGNVTEKNRYIGGCEDQARGRVLYFNWNPGGQHGIYCLDKRAGQIYTVMLNSDVDGGLNFSKDSYIHSSFFINNNLYWPDGTNNEPRRLNVEAGIKAHHPTYDTPFAPYTLSVAQSVISWIRRQPGLPLSQMKQTLGSPFPETNFTRYGSFQFAYRYRYRDFEISTLGPYSSNANYNAETDPFNSIDITFPIGEYIEQDVEEVDLIMISLPDNNYFVIKSWNRKVPAEAAQIVLHNAGIAALEYTFYNDSRGPALSDAYKVKPYDFVPTYAQAAEVARQRSYLGNYTIGYDTPLKSSLSVNFNLQNIGTTVLNTVVGTWYRYGAVQSFGNVVIKFVLQTTVPIGPIAPAPVYYYEVAGVTTPPPYPFTANQSDLTFVGSNIAQINAHYSVGNVRVQDLTQQGATTVVNLNGAPITNLLSKIFKTDSTYKVSIHFTDFYGRKSGIYTNNELLIDIPDTGIIDNNYVVFLNWVLSNSNAAAEIPDWAYYYSINITKCLRTRFFEQGVGGTIYVTKDSETGEYTFPTVPTAYDTGLAGIAIDLKYLQSFGMGYSFQAPDSNQPGDFVKIVIGSTLFQLSILAQVGSWIICELADAGTLNLTNSKFEIYSPYQQSTNEPFFETTNIYPITNPTTPTRGYSTTEGTIGGDVWLLSRILGVGTFAAEAMSPNDKFWRIWNTDAGRPNFIDDIGKKTITNQFAFSNTLINGTKTNGLSSFEALNVAEVPIENGPLRRLILAQAVEQIGSVMLAICERETCAIYLGKVQVLSTTGSSFLSTSQEVVGTINPLKGSLGTLHPESAFAYNGLVFWLDVLNGTFVQYSEAGLEPISRYNLVKDSEQFCLALLKLTNIQIEQLGSRPFVPGGVDPYHKEACWTIPATLAEPFNGYLPDYGSPYRPYPYQLYDGFGATWVFKFMRNQWQGKRTFEAEGMIRSGNDFFGFREGQIWKYNDPNPLNQNTFFGRYENSYICYIENDAPSVIKSFENISVEANMAPVWSHFLTEYPYIQGTDLVESDYSSKEGKWYSTIKRNRLDPNISGLFDEKVVIAEKLRAVSMKVILEFNVTQQQLNLNFVNDGYIPSVGHTP